MNGLIIDKFGNTTIGYTLKWVKTEVLAQVDWNCIYDGWVKETLKSALIFLKKNGEEICRMLKEEVTNISKMPAYLALATAASLVGWLCALSYNRI